jgi:hypothetical protein
VLAESFLVKSSGHSGVGLGEGERDAISHIGILAPFETGLKDGVLEGHDSGLR